MRSAFRSIAACLAVLPAFAFAKETSVVLGIENEFARKMLR